MEVLIIYILHELKGSIILLKIYVYHVLYSKKMVTYTLFRIKGFKLIILECVLNKWNKEREPPAMIKRLKVTIP